MRWSRKGPPGGRSSTTRSPRGRLYEQRITGALSRVVFDHVYPKLVTAVACEAPVPQRADPAWLAEARETSLRLLYRLLFLFYAEDRELLPVRHEGYAAYSLRSLREAAAEVVDQKRALSPRAPHLVAPAHRPVRRDRGERYEHGPAPV
jgi:hypothetical protein